MKSRSLIWELFSFPAYMLYAVLGLVAQLHLTLCDPMDCGPPGSSVHGHSPNKNTGVGCHALLQGIFPTQGLNSGLPHCRWILYHLSHQGSPRRLEWAAYPFSRGHLPNSGIEPGYPALQVDSLPAELQRSPYMLYYIINIPLSTVIIASCKFCYFIFSVSALSQYFPFFIFISPLTNGLFRSIT